MLIDYCEQRTDEWYTKKLSVPSASNFSKIVTTKGEPSKSAKKYMYRLAVEAVSGIRSKSYQSAAMKHGIKYEPQARAVYEWETDEPVQEVGMVYPDEQQRYLCSPDGLIGEGLDIKKGMEIKCPDPDTHVDYLFTGKLPTDYFTQVQGSMLVTGLDVWTFMSYYPNINIAPLIIEVERDEPFLHKLKEHLDEFVYELPGTIRRLKEMRS